MYLQTKVDSRLTKRDGDTTSAKLNRRNRRTELAYYEKSNI